MGAGHAGSKSNRTQRQVRLEKLGRGNGMCDVTPSLWVAEFDDCRTMALTGREHMDRELKFGGAGSSRERAMDQGTQPEEMFLKTPSSFSVGFSVFYYGTQDGEWYNVLTSSHSQTNQLFPLG